jgi:hypothetical protein
VAYSRSTLKRRLGKREANGSERHYKGVGEGTEFNIGFEGSQALPVCPSGKCKHLTGTIEV